MPDHAHGPLPSSRVTPTCASSPAFHLLERDERNRSSSEPPAPPPPPPPPRSHERAPPPPLAVNLVGSVAESKVSTAEPHSSSFTWFGATTVQVPLPAAEETRPWVWKCSSLMPPLS